MAAIGTRCDRRRRLPATLRFDEPVREHVGRPRTTVFPTLGIDTPRFVQHFPWEPSELHGRDEFEAQIRAFRAAFPDRHGTIAERWVSDHVLGFLERLGKVSER